MKRAMWMLALAVTAPAMATSWQFDAPVDVIAARAGIHPHLSGAGRRHIAVQGKDVAVVWEDNRSGQPQVYVALRSGVRPFSKPIRLSTGQTAYEPAIVSAGPENFVVAWEQDDAIHARHVAANGTLGPVVQLSSAGSQVTLAALEGRVTAVWSEPQGRNRVLKLATLSVTAEGQLQVPPPVAVETNPPAGATPSFPAVVVSRAGTVVAWEDRRTVSTAIFYSHSPDGREFSAPRLLNERRDPPADSRYGKGTTAMRVALTAQGENGIAAVWLDKRTLGNGFDAYAAFSTNGGVSFGPNQKVQDNFANTFAQLNAVIAAQPGRIVAIWNDDRDGHQDLWLSWPVPGGGWNENLAVPGASGAGDQTHPAVVMDASQFLHIVWLDRPNADGPTRLRYLRARYIGK